MTLLSVVGLLWLPSLEAFTEKVSGENNAPTSFNFFGMFALLMTSVIVLVKGPEVEPNNKIVSYFSIYPSNFSLGIGSVGSGILIGVGISVLAVHQEKYAFAFIVAGIYVGCVTWILWLMLQHLIKPVELSVLSQKQLALISISAFVFLFFLELFNIQAKLNSFATNFL